MTKVDLDVTKIYDWLEQSKARINILRGGTRSSKSYSMAQHFIFNKLVAGNNRVIIVARKTLPALRKTAMKLIIDLLDEYHIFDHCKINKRELELRYKNNLMYFMSLDDPGKIGSIDFNDIWLEEAVDFTLEDFRMFNIRASRKGENNQLYLSFNPISALHWIKTELIDKRTEGLAEHVSTYKDNLKHLSKEIIFEIEDLINQDQNFYKIYTLGQWGVLENIIYGNWKTFDEPEKFDEISFGVDWAFNNPSAILKCYWIDNKVIWQEKFYAGGLTQSELVTKAIELIPEEDRNNEMFCDSAEPALIEEFYRAGFNVHRAKKDVNDGISYVKTHLLGITNDSPNLTKELQSYSWKKDKNGNVLDDVVKFNDHLCDAGRYATFSKAKDFLGESKNVW